MNIYRWHSDLLKQYYQGDLIVCASSPDEAREMLRSHLNEWIKEFRPWEDDDLELYNLYNGIVKIFERDIASEPEVHQQLWLFGSE